MMVGIDGSGGGHPASYKSADFNERFYLRVANICNKPPHYRSVKEQTVVWSWQLYQLLHILIYALAPPVRARLDNRLELHKKLLFGMYSDDAALLFEQNPETMEVTDYMQLYKDTREYTHKELVEIEGQLVTRAQSTRERIEALANKDIGAFGKAVQLAPKNGEESNRLGIFNLLTEKETDDESN